MADLGSFLKGVADSQLKQNERAAEIEAYKKKLELAQKLQLQLQERKMRLAKQYPTYNKYVTTAMGDVIGLDTQGGMKQVYTADADTKSLLGDYKKAMSAKANAVAERVPSQIALDEAKAGLAEEKTKNPQKFVSQPRPAIQKAPANQLSASGANNAYMQWLYQNGSNDPISGKQPLPDTPENYQKWKSSVSQRNLLLPGGSGPDTSMNPTNDLDPEALMQAMGFTGD